MKTPRREIAKVFVASLSLLLVLIPRSHSFVPLEPRWSSQIHVPLTTHFLASSLDPNLNEVEEDDNDEWITAEIAEVIQSDQEDWEEELDWIPDREKATQMRKQRDNYQHSKFSEQPTTPPISTPVDATFSNDNVPSDSQKVSPYTEEEEELIISMGGKTEPGTSKREPGFLGDSTLEEIATDYSVPVCYLADVLCMWGVPVPINVHDRLGDLVTGEQAFAILEAVNSLDVAALHDRYSNTSLLNLCNEWDIDITEAFEMAMKEGWSLPFGVHTVLRIEQEDELLRVLGDYYPA